MQTWFDAQLDQKILDGIYSKGTCNVAMAESEAPSLSVTVTVIV